MYFYNDKIIDYFNKDLKLSSFELLIKMKRININIKCFIDYNNNGIL